ncbi:MAG: hypothetical protein P8171_18215 [Candidatus Thiodiazotropha sp.]
MRWILYRNCDKDCQGGREIAIHQALGTRFASPSRLIPDFWMFNPVSLCC